MLFRSIGQGGEIYQFVQLEDIAWHAKGWNNDSIGIEHVARSPGELKQWATLSEHTRRSLVPEGAAIDGLTDPGFHSLTYSLQRRPVSLRGCVSRLGGR